MCGCGQLLVSDFQCFQIHVSKIKIGKLARILIEPMSLGDSRIEWVESVKYLGVTISGGASLSFCNDVTKRHFLLRVTVFMLMSSS